MVLRIENVLLKERRDGIQHVVVVVFMEALNETSRL